MSDEELEEAGVNGTTAAESPTPPEHATRKRKAKVPERKVDAKKKKGQTKKNPEAGLSNISDMLLLLLLSLPILNGFVLYKMDQDFLST